VASAAAPEEEAQPLEEDTGTSASQSESSCCSGDEETKRSGDEDAEEKNPEEAVAETTMAFRGWCTRKVIPGMCLPGGWAISRQKQRQGE